MLTNINKPGLINLALFRNNTALKSLVQKIPDRLNKHHKSTTTAHSSWDIFDSSLRRHAESLYVSHDIDKMEVPLNCLMLTLILYILEKMPSLKDACFGIRYDLVTHGNNICRSICSQLQLQYKNDNHEYISVCVLLWIWNIFQTEFGFITGYYLDDRDIRQLKGETKTRTKHAFDHMCYIMSTCSSQEISQTYFIQKFCNGYNILPTLKAKYAHFLCKEARTQRYNLPINKFDKMSHKT